MRPFTPRIRWKYLTITRILFTQLLHHMLVHLFIFSLLNIFTEADFLNYLLIFILNFSYLLLKILELLLKTCNLTRSLHTFRRKIWKCRRVFYFVRIRRKVFVSADNPFTARCIPTISWIRPNVWWFMLIHSVISFSHFKHLFICLNIYNLTKLLSDKIIIWPNYSQYPIYLIE